MIVTTGASNDFTTGNNTGSATISPIGTAGLTLTTTASPTMFSGVGQTITFTYTVTNSGNVTVTGVSVTDTKVSPISCAATTLAAGASTTCTGSYTTTAADVNATSITSVATARGTFAGAAVASAAVTTTVKIDVEAVRKATKSAIQSFLSQRANMITSMGPDTGQMHDKLTGSLFGGTSEPNDQPSGLGGPRRTRLARSAQPAARLCSRRTGDARGAGERSRRSGARGGRRWRPLAGRAARSASAARPRMARAVSPSPPASPRCAPPQRPSRLRRKPRPASCRTASWGSARRGPSRPTPSPAAAVRRVDRGGVLLLQPGSHRWEAPGPRRHLLRRRRLSGASGSAGRRARADRLDGRVDVDARPQRRRTGLDGGPLCQRALDAEPLLRCARAVGPLEQPHRSARRLHRQLRYQPGAGLRQAHGQVGVRRPDLPAERRADLLHGGAGGLHQRHRHRDRQPVDPTLVG